jgi:hypothetical protein
VELDAVSEPELDQVERLGAADLVVTHIGPVDVPSGDIEHQTIGQPWSSLMMVFGSEPSGFADSMRLPLRRSSSARPNPVRLRRCCPVLHSEGHAILLCGLPRLIVNQS